ncbi:hypothetical protein DFH94DRAFT_303050 [Russula ochroleuca]|uniref:Uncharacterized protein n=1 Tax=Russula ochroleuca TaxID=152965 RepID=A0A9P5N0D4_9AGAM|nr:hypothetical protein DFH94DRAFT_303050 [Russula ochroleuca]
MNNPRSMVLGWVSLIAVAGASFYFAKQSINERRRQQDIITGERPSARLDGRERSARDEARTPQAPREEHPNLVAGSGFSGSKDDAT